MKIKEEKICNYEPCGEINGRLVVIRGKSFSKSRASNAVSSVSKKNIFVIKIKAI